MALDNAFQIDSFIFSPRGLNVKKFQLFLILYSFSVIYYLLSFIFCLNASLLSYLKSNCYWALAGLNK